MKKFAVNCSRNARRPYSLLLLLLCSIIVGCTAGSGEGLDISGRPLSEGGDVPLAATLASIQANVFNPSCSVSGCHSGANAPQGLRLDAANSFTNLVGIRSREDSSFFRVAPGNPDQSYLIHKLEGTASVGEQMPLGGPPESGRAPSIIHCLTKLIVVCGMDGPPNGICSPTDAVPSSF